MLLSPYPENIYEKNRGESLRVRLVRELGGEGRGGILTEGRGDILIKSVFGSQGEGMDFKIILLFYP